MQERPLTATELAAFQPTERPLTTEELQAFKAPQENTILEEVGSVAARFNRGAIDSAKLLLRGAGLLVDTAGPGGISTVLNEGPTAFKATGKATDLIEQGFQATGVNEVPKPQTGVGEFAGDVAEFAGAGLGGGGLKTAVTSSIGAVAGGNVATTLFPDNAVAEGIGTLAGALTPAGFNAAGKRVLRGSGQKAIQQNLDTFTRVGVKPTAGQVSEGGIVNFLESGVSKIPGGGKIVDSAKKAQTQLGKTIGKLTGEVSAERAGRVITNSLFGESGFTKKFSKTTEKLFNKLGAKIPPSQAVPVSKTSSIFSELTNPIPGAEPLSKALSNPSVLKIAKGFNQSIKNGALPFKALQDTRSAVGRMLSSSEVITKAPRSELKRIYGALTEDLKAAATASGGLKEFNRANNFYKGGIKRVDDFLEKLAKKGALPEDVFIASVQGKNGASKIRAIRKSMTPAEWDVVAKTHLSRLGQAKAGAATELGQFSSETFFTNLGNMSPEARTAIFGNTKGIGKSLADLTKAAERIRIASRSGANLSGSSQGAAQIGVISSFTTGGAMLAGGASGGLIPIVAAASTVAGANVGARLFSNPAFVKWLARSSNLKPAQIASHIGQLNVVAKNNPDIAEDIGQILGSINEGNK